MSGLTIFEHEQQSFRTAYIEGRVVFCLSDVLAGMGTKTNTYQAQALIDENMGKGCVVLLPLQTNGGIQDTLFITEIALTFLLSRSRTEAGKKLNRWIHTEILPSIRSTGSYTPAQAQIKERVDLAMFICERACSIAQLSPAVSGQLAIHSAIAICPEYAAALKPVQQSLIDSTAKDDVLLTATQIGKRVNLSGQKVNKKLIELGLQTKNEGKKSSKEPDYLMTDRGHEFAQVTQSAIGSGTTIQQLRWYESVCHLFE
jgi:anti-repressor protein